MLAGGAKGASLHSMTLQKLAGATAPAAAAAAAEEAPHTTAALEAQLAALQRELKAKQAELDAGRADLAQRQDMLRYAAGVLAHSRSWPCAPGRLCCPQAKP